MFIPKKTNNSYLNPKCEARAKGTGCAVYALAPIAKGELVSLWGGDVVHQSELDYSMPRLTERAIQIDEELYLLTAAEKEPNDCFNHSCDPNLGFSGQVGLVAMRDVKAGEELTFDYATSDGSAYDEFECRCGAKNCRGKVTGADWSLPVLWKKYDGYFSPYLARRIARLRGKDLV
ncbi:MAG: SET domain-containing protein-lysine N-methyltransferase [Anaerolineales bacterium]|nr:SET domain-containing protein-lysine N-methyltransferase [Anaerolineales bacterium]